MTSQGRNTSRAAAAVRVPPALTTALFWLAFVVSFIGLILTGGHVSAQDGSALFEDFDYGNFDNPTSIDNEWLPLRPGTQWVHEGSTDEDGERVLIASSSPSPISPK